MKRRSLKEEVDPLPNAVKSAPSIRDDSLQNPDSQMSGALFNLSVKDRNAIEEEIHGVSCMAPEETPQLLEDALDKFHLEITRIDRKPGYDRAQELLEKNPPGHPRSYIHARGYKLRFLRSVLFDASSAAKRYCRYLDVLLELYGDTALKRPVRMNDLGREEMSYLRKGYFQVLPCRDRSGRRIMCLVPNSREDVAREVLLKVYIYLWASILGGCEIRNNDLDQLETQRKGVVVIFFPSFEYVYEDMRDFNFARTRTSINKIVGGIIPVRLVAVHCCFPNIAWAHALTTNFQMVLSSWLPRTKFHFGKNIELRYELQGYGVPSDAIPSTDTGNVKSGNLKQWIKLRTYMESQTQQTENDGASGDESVTSSQSFPPLTHIVECPGSNDVIFRRGKAMNHHPGNAKFLNLIESQIYEHTLNPETTPARRVAIEIELIQQIRQGGGRFLKWEIDKGWWVDMAGGTGASATNPEIDKETQSKVHYAFRDFRKKMLRLEKQPVVNPSSTYVFARQDGQKRKRYSTASEMDDANMDCNMTDGCMSGGSQSFKET